MASHPSMALVAIRCDSRRPAFIREDGWQLDEALDGWTSDVSVGRSSSSRRRGSAPGPPSTVAPTSVSETQTMLHEIYLSMQRQQEPEPELELGLEPAPEQE